MQDSRLNSSEKRSSTPNQRQKYNNYTPRKRYIKEQQQLTQYLQNQQRASLTSSPQFQINHRNFYNPHYTSSAQKKRQLVKNKPMERNFKLQVYPLNYDFPSPIKQCPNSVNSKPSLRKQKYSRYADQNKKLNRLLDFEPENVNNSYINLRTHRGNNILDEQPLTPRKAYKKNENDSILTEKMIVLQQKITRLQKMNPKRSNTPKKSRIIEQPKWQLEFQKQERDTSVSSRVISDKENELMSRVSLDRLVQQQQCENEIDMIQDLSYKISSKLQTIIRNFG